MAITKSAKKALRVSNRKRAINGRLQKKMKDSVKEVRILVADTKKSAGEKLKQAFKALDKAAKRGTIKKGQADRKKSRLAKFVAKLEK
jgi:small subunit ribosomal protein S20